MKKTDYTRPSTWIFYKNNLCGDCHADCCRLPVEVHLSEFVKMGLCFEEELEESKELIKRLKRSGVIRLFDYKTDIATLTQKSDGSCLFLDENRRCTIYDKRPKTCREFPRVGPRPNFCPYNQK